MAATTPSGSYWTHALFVISMRFVDRDSGLMARSPWLMSHSAFEQVVMTSPSAASSTSRKKSSSHNDWINYAIDSHVLPVSRQATFAHASWLSTSHFCRLRMTRRLSLKGVVCHSFCASDASLIFSSISTALSVSNVSIWYPVAGSKQVIYLRSGSILGGASWGCIKWDSRWGSGIFIDIHPRLICWVMFSKLKQISSIWEENCILLECGIGMVRRGCK